MPPRGRTSTGRTRSSSTRRSTSRANRGAASRRARSAARARSRAAAARRRDAARPSVRAAARRSSSSRGNRGAASRTARAAARSRSASRAASRRDAARPSVVRSRNAARQRTALSRSAGERGRGASTSQSQGRSAAAANQARQRARSLGSRRRAATAAAARRRDANRPSVIAARNAARQRAALSRSAGERGRGASTSPSQGRLAAEANQARQRAISLGNKRRAAAAAAANKQAAQSLLSAGYRNLAGDPNRSTLGQQFMSGIRNLMRGELGFVFPGSGKSGTPPPRRTSCPTPDMRILMADGSLKVAGDLQVGDTVRAAHEDTLEWGDHKVTHKEIVEDEVVILKFENSSIKCSPTHKVYLSNDSKWVEVQDLKEGDVVKAQDGDDTFVSLEKIDSGDVVVLTVEDAHTYVAEGILSHNKRPKRKDDGENETDTTTETTTTTEMPPEIIEDYEDLFPTGPRMGGGMMGGLGGFGYSPALMAYESQQGAGQVPYYMAAARNAMTPNMSPAFMHAARNYDILGGSQRTRARPIEMMSARERAEIMNMGSNFNVPNYNSPYPQSPGQSQFDYFRNMVSSGGAGQPADYAPIADMLPKGPPARFGGPGKGAPRPMPQDQARAMGSGIASLMRSGMFG